MKSPIVLYHIVLAYGWGLGNRGAVGRNRASATMSSRLNSLLGLMYFLAFYRMITFAELTWRHVWISAMQLAMVGVHLRTVLFLKKRDNPRCATLVPRAPFVQLCRSFASFPYMGLAFISSFDLLWLPL